MQRRAFWTDCGGTFGLPGGARRAGESAEQAAIRETTEETGLLSAEIRVRASVVTASPSDTDWTYTTVVADAEELLPTRCNGESLELRWVPENEVAGLPLHPGFAASWPQLRTLRFPTTSAKRSSWAVTGWRFWTVPPNTSELCAPYKHSHGEPWPATRHRATCYTNSEHVPPHDHCECGIYCDTDAHAAIRRALFAVQVPTYSTRDPRAALVVGRVALDGAVPFVPRLSGIPELRAASGEILELYILPLRHQPDAHQLVQPLAARYCVPVVYGLPDTVRVAS